MTTLRDYQEEAVNALLDGVAELLSLGNGKSITLKAPTGAGKTLIAGSFLRGLGLGRVGGRSFAFLWTAPRQLHAQSRLKLESLYQDDRSLKCLQFDDLNGDPIGENEILFLNWESINRSDNIFIRDNETDHNLTSIIQATVDAGRTIVLVIDESHHAASTDISRGLMEIMQPSVTILVSATPTFESDLQVAILRERVIQAEMIKKHVSINPGFANELSHSSSGFLSLSSDASESSNEAILRIALKKRNELRAMYEAVGSSVNPLLMVQLPDRRAGLDDMAQEIEDILKKYKITTGNGRLAIYLSEGKTNLEGIAINASPVDVMIFKQAIALGWDCPRASILVLLREMKSYTFSVQTLGRILRMPELRHYSEEGLNIGYVYTNLGDLAIERDAADTYITSRVSKRSNEYEELRLRSVYGRRLREVTRLAARFVKSFDQAAVEMELAQKLEMNVQALTAKLLSDGQIANPDAIFEHLAEGEASHSATVVERIQLATEVQRRFDEFAIESLPPFAPEQRSVGRLKEALHRFMTSALQYEYGGVAAQTVLLHEANRQVVTDTINRAKELYQAAVQQNSKEVLWQDAWDVPAELTYGANVREQNYSRSVMIPFYEARDVSKPERDFAAYLDNRPDVTWWFKNGERDRTFFAVPYTDSDGEKPFYVDWIVSLADGRLGLFDTKSGITASIAATKANGLAVYIAANTTTDLRLFGGIVVFHGGSWRYWEGIGYHFDAALTGWKILSL